MAPNVEELDAYIRWCEACLKNVPNKPDHQEMCAILEGEITRARRTIQELREKNNKTKL